MMRSTLFVLFSALSTLSTVSNAIPQGTPSDLIVRGGKDDGVLLNYARDGLGFYYYTGRENREKMMRPCKVWCPKNGGDDQAIGVRISVWCLFPLHHTDCEQCKGPPVAPTDPKFDKSLLWEDDDGNPFVAGNCHCDFEFAEIVLDIVIEGLSKLDKIFCAVMLTAFNTILNVGLMFIPGGQVLGAAKRAVNGAKTFTENALTGASFFGDVGLPLGVALSAPSWSYNR